MDIFTEFVQFISLKATKLFVLIKGLFPADTDHIILHFLYSQKMFIPCSLLHKFKKFWMY